MQSASAPPPASGLRRPRALTALAAGSVACVVSLLALTAAAPAAHAAQPTKVLGLHVEGTDLSDKDRKDLFQVVQAKLKAYPDVAVVQPPDEDLLEVMMELECIDLDPECLTKLAAKYEADRVFYAAVEPVPAGFDLLVRVVDASGAVVRDQVTTVEQRADLASTLSKELVAVFGEPPKPKPRIGMLVIQTNVAGAQIYIDGELAGTGRVERKLPPGEVSVRVAREGYEEQIFAMTVKERKKITRRVTLDPLPAVAEPPPPPEPEPPAPSEDPQFYETWWFWTLVGVGVAGASVGIAAGAGAFDGESGGSLGPVTLSVDRAGAWRDRTLRGGAR